MRCHTLRSCVYLFPDVKWVELLEMDGVSPYTYSEELPYDEILQQHQAI